MYSNSALVAVSSFSLMYCNCSSASYESPWFNKIVVKFANSFIRNVSAQLSCCSIRGTTSGNLVRISFKNRLISDLAIVFEEAPNFKLRGRNAWHNSRSRHVLASEVSELGVLL